jgi:hypothetical protein
MKKRWIGQGGLIPAALSSTFPCFCCASTMMESIQRDPNFQIATIHKVLIVSIASTPDIRKQIEEEYVRQWRKRGVDAIASSAVLPVGVDLDKAKVAPFAKAQRYDAVLVSRLLKKERFGPGKRTDAAAQEETQHESTLENVLFAAPVYATSYDLATVETTLYDATSEKRLWTGTSETTVVGEVSKHIRPFVKTILKSLYRPPVPDPTMQKGEVTPYPTAYRPC